MLSKFPILASNVLDFSDLLWTDFPNAQLPMQDDKLFPSPEALAVQCLSTTGHWVVPISLSPTMTFNALMFHATPPVFDGPEDRNGWRNHDETAFWTQFLDTNAITPFAIMGTSNLDPIDGEGRHMAMKSRLTHPKLQDPEPASKGGISQADPDHSGPANLDTVDYDGPGNLRVDYVLPSADLNVAGAGVFWPAPSDTLFLGTDGLAAGRHRLVWVDVIVNR